MCRAQLLWIAVVAALAACSAGPAAAPADGADATAGSATIRVGEGLRATLVTDALQGPTQMTVGPDGRLWVAQLAGAEGAGEGQVVAVDAAGDVQVMLTDLDKPTGLAWLDGAWWIQTPDAVLRAEGTPPGEPAAVVDGLPSNGRSNGTLTPTPDGTLLFATSGRERDGGGVDDSGVLWELDPGAASDPAPVATGLKNAYAHAVVDGELWSTEIAEPIGGVAAPDELVRIRPGADHGWPACVGDRTPVAAYGGDDGSCADTVRPAATFGAGATPTSVVRDPFGDGLLVALWVAGDVVAVPRTDPTITAPPTPSEVVVDGLRRPQHLLVDGDGLLVSDHAAGEIWRVAVDGAG